MAAPNINDRVCVGCGDPEHGDVYSFCLVHGVCKGCRNPERGDVVKGDFSRSCPMHGIVAEDRRAEMLAREQT